MMLTRLRLIFLLVMFGTAVSAEDLHAVEQSPPEVVSKATMKVIKRASGAAQKGRLSSAARIHEQALLQSELSDLDREILLKSLASLQIGMKDFDKAVQILETVDFTDQAQDQLLLQRLNFALLIQDQYENAQKVIKMHGTGHPSDDPTGYHIQLQMYAFLGAQDELLRVLKEFSDELPDNDFARVAYAGSLETQNREAVLIARFTPIFPARAERSGHCDLSVEVGVLGKVQRVIQTDCTEKAFKTNSIRAVEKFVYLPKLVDGKAVSSFDYDVSVDYRLTDGKGKVIPPKHK